MKKMNIKDLPFYASILLGLFLCFSALGKFTQSSDAMAMFEGDLEDYRIIIAIGEIISVALFIYPRTQTLGTWMMSSYFGGAILLHMTRGESFLLPLIFLAVVWIIAFFRGAKPVI